jgi:hypothetical protein
MIHFLLSMARCVLRIPSNSDYICLFFRLFWVYNYLFSRLRYESTIRCFFASNYISISISCFSLRILSRVSSSNSFVLFLSYPANSYTSVYDFFNSVISGLTLKAGNGTSIFSTYALILLL